MQADGQAQEKGREFNRLDDKVIQMMIGPVRPVAKRPQNHGPENQRHDQDDQKGNERDKNLVQIERHLFAFVFYIMVQFLYYTIRPCPVNLLMCL